MIILGANTEDKGNQLEQLARDLLAALKYQNITRSEILPGGSEVDVTAEYQVPGLGNGIRKGWLAASKEKTAPIDSTQWLKFLGKVLSEEKLLNEEVYGA
ncbi:MAG: hypothetical protein ACM359_14030, partial [Bacillota bacterium]